jgi:LacI family transcriptional regulator
MTNRDLPKNKMNWTIHDIARVAGVSAKTVSRVVNEETGVGTLTRARIKEIVEQVGYQPHTGARTMRTRPRDCLGISLCAPVNEVPVTQQFIVWLFNELYRIFTVKHQFLCWDLNPPFKENAPDYARGLWQQRYAGLLLTGPLASTDKTIFRVHESGCPYLVLSRLDALPEVSHAAVDYEEGTYISVKYLIERGHKKIAMLKGFKGYQPDVERRRGYIKAMDEAGLSADENLMQSVTFAARDLVSSVHRLLLDRDVTAIIDCSGCEDGESIREGARRAGRIPGNDFEVVCWSYSPDACVMSEAVKHLWLPVMEAAAEGFRILSQWFEGQHDGPINILYRPTLYKHTGLEAGRPTRLFDVLS